MQGITKGTVLGNRYELTSEVSDSKGLARWIAKDEKLGRDVALTIVPADSAFAEAALDSARRAAGVEDSHLVRVLDAGRDDDFAYIVEEPHTGAHNLADLVRFEPIHPEEARRIVGETASALEAARQRGLHHLILSPRHVLRLADGSIAVTQVAVGGALAGRDDVTSAEATTIDTRALVNLLYTALTGEWPGAAKDVEGLKGISVAERRADGQIATPSELVDGIPNDLDAMCRQALNHDEGPRTPGDVARQLAPWSAQMITAPGKPRRSEGEVSAAKDEPEQTFTVRRAPDGDPAKRATGVGAVGAAALAAAGSQASSKDGASKGATAADVSSPASPTSAGVGSASADATDPGVTSAPQTRVRMPRRVNTPDPADATMVGRRVEFDADETTQFTLDDEDSAYARSTYDPSFEELDPPVPGFHGGTDDPDPASSKMALTLVALLVLAALVLAAFGLHGLGSSSSPAAASTSPGAPTSTATSAKPSPKSSASSSSSAAGTAVDPVGASFVNTDGLRQASSLSPANAIDGNPGTEWMSLRYRRQSWGGYDKLGALSINLGDSTAVKTIKVTPGKETPLTADVYVGDEPGTSGTKVGSISNATSEQTVSSTATGKYVTIFIPTQTQPSGKTYYMSSVAEVTVEK